MAEKSEEFQEPKFQSLGHDLLFYCRFLFVFCLRYFKQTNYLFMFYSMVDKCMTHGRSFHYFGNSRSCGNIHCSYEHYQPGKITLHFTVLTIEYLVAASYELWMM